MTPLRAWAAERCLDLACWLEPSAAGIWSSLASGGGEAPGMAPHDRTLDAQNPKSREGTSQRLPSREQSLIRVRVPALATHPTAGPMAGMLRTLATDVERGVVVSFEIGWPQEPGRPLALIAFPRIVGEA